MIANIVTAVTWLANLGAKHVKVGNSLDLNNYPGFKREMMDSEVKKFYISMNTQLPGEIEKLAQELKIQVEIFDLAAIAEHIRSNPDQYGLTQLESTCTDQPYSSGSVCKNPEEYYYWGYSYLPRIVHQAMQVTNSPIGSPIATSPLILPARDLPSGKVYQLTLIPGFEPVPVEKMRFSRRRSKLACLL